jgi:hypothetical protein
MDMIHKIYELIPKQESIFKTKKIIDRIRKNLNRNEIATSCEFSLKVEQLGV